MKIEFEALINGKVYWYDRHNGEQNVIECKTLTAMAKAVKEAERRDSEFVEAYIEIPKSELERVELEDRKRTIDARIQSAELELARLKQEKEELQK